MKEIHIIFDGPPDHEGGRFVEAEDKYGHGIRIGEWAEKADGFWHLVLTPESFDNVLD